MGNFVVVVVVVAVSYLLPNTGVDGLNFFLTFTLRTIHCTLVRAYILLFTSKLLLDFIIIIIITLIFVVITFYYHDGY
jgi:hypothetical protein